MIKHPGILAFRESEGNHRIRQCAFLSIAFLFHSSGGVAQIPSPAHVVIVIEENHDSTQIIGSSAAPYINALASDGKSALFTQSSALTHPSQPNYLMLFSGSQQGVTNDNVPQGLPFTSLNLGGSLLTYGRSFVGYCEDLPSPGFTDATSGAYARKHNPWVNWQGTSTNGILASANQPLTHFPVDFDSLPSVSFVVPNQDNDMHTGRIHQQLEPAMRGCSNIWTVISNGQDRITVFSS